MNNQELLTIFATLAQETTEQDPLIGYTVTSTEVMDEATLHKQLSKQLIELETTIEYTVEQVQSIREIAEKMFLNIDEKAELLMRCEWLVMMKDVEGSMEQLATNEDVQAAKHLLGRVQTCPFKNELLGKLEELGSTLALVQKKLSAEDALIEATFETGNETFINLGSFARNHIIAEVLQADGKVETVITKAKALEAQVQATIQAPSIEALEVALAELPLQHLASIEEAHKEEVSNLLFANKNWQSLFNLDLQIRNTANQVYRKHNPVQKGAMTTLVMDEKVMEQLGVQ